MTIPIPTAPATECPSLPALSGVPPVESPFFAQLLDTMGLSEAERAIAVQLHDRGYAVFDFPDVDIHARMDRIIARLEPEFGADLAARRAGVGGHSLRRQDFWLFDEDVRAIATNQAVVALLSKLYGRAAFPFQTLSFPVGTQQHPHSDSIHFSSLPERFMCGVWLAFEDVDAGAGPLVYYPGSHQWPIVSNAMLGRRGHGGDRRVTQDPFEEYWRAMVEAKGCEPEIFLARKGQALIWAANLLHGGGIQTDPALTRWSQVTHYYFEDCLYYTPAFSDEALGRFDLRTITNVATGAVEPNRYLGTLVTPQQPAKDKERPSSWLERRRRRKAISAELPDDFDADRYYRLNPDVALAGLDAGRHYVLHGRNEGRPYKL